MSEAIKKLMNRPDLSTNEMLEAIKRSGYMLESEIIKYLASQGYFVESNKSVLDPITKVSREIDIIAEYYKYDDIYAKNNTACIVHFVFEIKNNLYPLVLINKLELSPNTEIWEGIKQIITIPEGIEYDPYEGFYDELIQDKNFIYTQYCSFQKKKKGKDEELMAIHPENLHSGLLKINQYCDEMVDRWYNNNPGEDVINYKENYFRHFVYLPILLLNDNLYELDFEMENKTNLRQVNLSKLIYNYHYLDELRTSVIFIMTKRGLSQFLHEMRDLEEKNVKKMIKLKGYNNV